MKYKVGDRVKIKSLDWYKENKNQLGRVSCGGKSYTIEMCFFCGKTLTIQAVGLDFYFMEEDNLGYEFTDEMIEGLVEKEKSLYEDCCCLELKYDKLTIADNICTDKVEIVLQDYELEQEDGKWFAVKKKKEYPKTYEECCKVMNYCCNPVATKTTHKEELIRRFQFLLLYRDTYWKIAGEEMGLGKPWKPDYSGTYDDGTPIKYVIYNIGTHIVKERKSSPNHILSFPTEEMRDAFKENFDKDLEFCKELL